MYRGRPTGMPKGFCYPVKFYTNNAKILNIHLVYARNCLLYYVIATVLCRVCKFLSSPILLSREVSSLKAHTHNCEEFAMRCVFDATHRKYL